MGSGIAWRDETEMAPVDLSSAWRDPELRQLHLEAIGRMHEAAAASELWASLVHAPSVDVRLTVAAWGERAGLVRVRACPWPHGCQRPCDGLHLTVGPFCSIYLYPEQ